MSDISIEAIRDYLLNLQDKICVMLETEDGKGKFIQDQWQRAQGGGGITRVLQNGDIIEKVGVNFSHVFGKQLPPSASINRPELAGCQFQALGISVVIHPLNPYAPTTHANLRFFIAEKKGQKPTWWFGGGFDLTPFYGFKEDGVHWHSMAREACQPFGAEVYPKFKNLCDQYFHLPHRNEPRGIGGIFFDDLNEWGFIPTFDFVKRVGEHFILAYQPILNKRKNIPFTNREREFQLFRRGRYVEFNLLYDRGTLFGLQSGGRTESILISLPPKVIWDYNRQPELGSKEEELYKEFLVIKDWLHD